MPPTPQRQVFIIHGHDARALAALIKFIKTLGLKHLTFEKVSDELEQPNPFIADVVRKGIEKADAVIALFTPDEQAVLFSSANNDKDRDKGRWQARPNVIFEAGVALGIAGDKTILVTLGGNISLFSDLAGMHFIDLTAPTARERLQTRLSKVLEIDLPKRQWKRIKNDFQLCVQNRWDYYDELAELESDLKNTSVYGLNRSLFEVVKGIALKHRGATWEDWTSKAFTEAIFNKYDQKKGETANSAYYYLIISGFLAFRDIDEWWHPHCGEAPECVEYWANSVEFSEITKRGISLLYKIQRTSES